ncbi:MAG: S8 family serine peptidase, partial [Peptoniphilus harei]|nr:S8 family serine peptidase [Peptoniphilus harei]
MNKNLKRYSSLGLSLIFVMSSFNGVFAEGNNINKPLSETERLVRSQKEMNFKKSKILEEFEKDETCLKVKREKVVYFVEFDDKANKDQVIQSLKEIKDVKVLYEYNILFKAVSVEAYPEVLDKLKSIKGVKDVERAGKLVPLMENARKLVGVDKASDYLKSLNAINANLGKNYDGRGMIIANIDTGMDASHKAMRIDEDAKGSLKLKKNDLKGSDKEFWLSDKVPHSFNYLNGGKITTEKYDDGSDYHDPHGMHIAGILAANDKDEDIKAHKGIRGIAPNAQLFSYKMYSDASDGFAGDETMFHAFEDCIKHDVDVISVSSGFTGTGLAGEKYWQAIRSLRKAGIPICVATGNYATSSSSSSWDRYANNALKMTDTGNVTRTAA